MTDRWASRDPLHLPSLNARRSIESCSAPRSILAMHAELLLLVVMLGALVGIVLILGALALFLAFIGW